jgi:hypothetical protein
VRFADDRVGQLSVTFGVKVLSDSRLRDACPERLQSNKKQLLADTKRHLSRAIFYKSAPSSIPELFRVPADARAALGHSVLESCPSHYRAPT